MASHKKSHGHEQEHANRNETDFKITARRNKLAGLWAAEKLGISGEAAEAYAKEVVAADLDEPGDADVIRKLIGDFKAKGQSISETEIRAALDKLAEEARIQIMG